MFFSLITSGAKHTEDSDNYSAGSDSGIVISLPKEPILFVNSVLFVYMIRPL